MRARARYTDLHAPLASRGLLQCVCMCVSLKLHITVQSGPVTLVIICHSHWSSQVGINDTYYENGCVYTANNQRSQPQLSHLLHPLSPAPRKSPGRTSTGDRNRSPPTPTPCSAAPAPCAAPPSCPRKNHPPQAERWSSQHGREYIMSIWGGGRNDVAKGCPRNRFHWFHVKSQTEQRLFARCLVKWIVRRRFSLSE